MILKTKCFVREKTALRFYIRWKTNYLVRGEMNNFGVSSKKRGRKLVLDKIYMLQVDRSMNFNVCKINRKGTI